MVKFNQNPLNTKLVSCKLCLFWFQVFDYDRFSRNDVVGEVCMSMDEFDVASNVEVWGEITKNKKVILLVFI